MKKRNSYYLVMILLIAGLMPGGCKKEEQSAPPPPPPKHAPAVKPPVPVQKQISTAKLSETREASLDFTNRKDPFKPFVAPQQKAEKPVAAAAAKARDLLPIQNFELSKFKVAGIIVGLKENRALVIDPTGKGYVLKQGMLIGSNDGRVSRITPTAVEVIESYNENGHIRKKTSRLTLPQKK